MTEHESPIEKGEQKMGKASPERHDGMELVGTVSVDSGGLVIVDPAYLKRVEFDETGHSEELEVGGTRKSITNIAKQAENARNAVEKRYDQILDGLGLAILPGYGDGQYEVFIKKDDQGRITQVVIDCE